MKRSLLPFLILAAGLAANGRAETETIDLKALAKKARPAVMLLVVSDAAGKEIATGTGFLVSSDGKLITNHHVIEHAASAVAKAEKGGKFNVLGVIADDAEDDIALLKLDGKDMPSLPLGSAKKIEPGTRVAVLGSPLGLEGTLSEGIISAVRELAGGKRYLQITAPVSHGSSGSPVLNSQGEVIGVASAVLVEGQSLNFAMPIEIVKSLLKGSEATMTLLSLSELAKRSQNDVLTDEDYRAGKAANLAGKNAEALKRIKSLTARFPNSSEAHFLLGNIYLDMRFDSDAVEAYQEAVRLDQNDSRAWSNLGLAYSMLGKYGDAIAACQRSIRLKPNDPIMWNSLGVAYLGSHQYGDAATGFQQAIKLDPTDAMPWGNLAIAQANNNHFDAAWRTVTELRKINPVEADRIADQVTRLEKPRAE